MKKIALLLLCGILISSVPAKAERNIGVFLNGCPISFDAQPMLKNDRTFVPVRKIFETFGMDVDWNGENQQIYSHNDTDEISMCIGCSDMWVNGKCVKLDVAPFIDCDRTFVPLRAIGEALKCVVDWDGKTSSVIINCGGSTVKPTAKPTQIPEVIHTSEPTSEPTAVPTVEPTAEPTAIPTVNPTAVPTVKPTAVPTAKPTAVPTVKPTAVPTAKPVSSEAQMEQEVLALVNKERAARGLNPLTWAEDLASVARAHSADMINRNFFSHTNPDGLSPFDRLKKNGISYRAAAENIAYGQKDAAAVMNGWMNSSGHRANILNANLKEIGVGAVKNQRGTIYWTQVFVSR